MQLQFETFHMRSLLHLSIQKFIIGIFNMLFHKIYVALSLCLKFQIDENFLIFWIVERRIAAIQAIQAAEVESLLSRLRLLRSYFSKEQLDTLALTFFQKNLPNLSVVKNEKYKVYELEHKNKNNDLLSNHDHALNIHASTDNTYQPTSGLYLSAKTGK